MNKAANQSVLINKGQQQNNMESISSNSSTSGDVEKKGITPVAYDVSMRVKYVAGPDAPTYKF